MFPITFFSDEEAITIPALSLLSRIAAIAGWPAVTSVTACGIGLIVWKYRMLRTWHVWILSGCLLAATITLGMMIDRPYALLVRFPPLIHFIQLAATALSAGTPSLFRLANAGWTIALGLVAWRLLPNWPKSARLTLAVAACLTPLGWTYHLLLFQACGEVALGLLTILLLTQLLQRPDGERLALYVGTALSAWILYRPTALALAVTTVALLFVLRRRQAAWNIALIAFPVGLVWVAVYATGVFQYSFLSSGSASERTFAIMEPLAKLLIALPEQLSLSGMLILIAGSIAVLWRRPSERPLLLLAWLFAIVYTAMHALLTLDRWYGYGRFNILMMLPLAVCAGSLVAWAHGKRWREYGTGITVIAALALQTPWNFVGFLQSSRDVSLLDRIERTVTGGVDPTPLPSIVEQHLANVDTMIVISPSHAFLDLLIARGLLTPVQRSSLIKRSHEWNPSLPNRPVLIQAPPDGRTYRTNISEVDEKFLLDAAAWAAIQTNKEIFSLGEEKVIVVR